MCIVCVMCVYSVCNVCIMYIYTSGKFVCLCVLYVYFYVRSRFVFSVCI